MYTSATTHRGTTRSGSAGAILLLTLPLLLVACQIIEVEQPAEATQGEVIEVTVTVGLYQDDENPWHGVLSVLVPEDWSFVSGTYSGDLGSGNMLESEAWADSTDIVLPAPNNMKWIGTISDEPYAVPADPPYFMEAILSLEVGMLTGEFGLGYFITTDAFATEDMAFTKSGKYDDNTADSLMNQPITVIPAKSTDDPAPPTEFALMQNFPNPFNATTTLGYALHESAAVRVFVYDLAGRLVAEVDEGTQSAGRHTLHFDGSELPSGSYLYRLEVNGEIVQSRLMTRLR